MSLAEENHVYDYWIMKDSSVSWVIGSLTFGWRFEKFYKSKI